MKLKIEIKSFEWWFWFLTLIAMVAGLSGTIEGFYLVIISLIQFVYFTVLRGFTAFPTQVRFVYATLSLSLYSIQRDFFTGRY